jgi:polyisoprenoid-binding protein YceI
MNKRVLAFCAIVAGLTISHAQLKNAQSIAAKSWVAYRLVHPLHVVDATSRSVQYIVELDPASKQITKVAAQVDVTTFDSGNSNRDSHAMEVIDALTYPDVQFTSTSVIQKNDSIFVTGKLTFHGVTNDVTMAGTVQWLPQEADVKGAFDLSLTAFKVERPALLMIPVEDKLSFTLVAAFALQ